MPAQHLQCLCCCAPVLSSREPSPTHPRPLPLLKPPLCPPCLQISRMPKENGARARTVVITQGKDPTVVAVEGKVTLFPVIALPQVRLAHMWC